MRRRHKCKNQIWIDIHLHGWSRKWLYEMRQDSQGFKFPSQSWLSCIRAWFFTANDGAYNICLLFVRIINNSSKSMLPFQIYSWHGRPVSMFPRSYHLGIDVEHKKPKSDYVRLTPKSNVLILSSTKCWCISPFSLANLKKHTNKTSHHVCS